MLSTSNFFCRIFWRTRLISFSIFLHIEEFRSKGKFYWITNAFLEVSKCISFPPLRMGVKYLPHLSLYATAIERIIVVLGTTSLNFYTKWHVVSKGIRFLAFLKKFVKERKRCVCFRIIHFPRRIYEYRSIKQSLRSLCEKKKFCVKGDFCNQERQLFTQSRHF